MFTVRGKGLREIAADARTFAAKVRDGSVTPPELSDGTFSVSNLGMYGITSFGAIVNSPQAAILAVGAITDSPVVVDGEVVPGKVMEITLSCDHRILYGAEGQVPGRDQADPRGAACALALSGKRVRAADLPMAFGAR